jgi:hypothetical protein
MPVPANGLPLVTAGASIRCDHGGQVVPVPSHSWITVQGRPLLVGSDLHGAPIVGCPNYGPTAKPCLRTLVVTAGRSMWIRVDGVPVVALDAQGLTDGTPPGVVRFRVHDPGQRFLTADR